jgi:hypothetical protein
MLWYNPGLQIPFAKTIMTMAKIKWNWLFKSFQKDLFPFNLRFPFVICSVSILVETASSVLAPLKAG